MPADLFFAETGRKTLVNRISDIEPFLAGASGTLLDIGCAEGSILRYYRDRFQSAVGLELDRGRAEAAAKLFEQDPGVTIHKGDIVGHSFDIPFDCVLLLGVLQHIEPIEDRRDVVSAALKNTKDILIIRTALAEARAPGQPSRANGLRALFRREKEAHTPIGLFAELAHEHGFRWLAIDNSYRSKDYRRGDLIVMQRVRESLGDWLD